MLAASRGAHDPALWLADPFTDDYLPDGTFVLAGSSIIYSIYSAGRMKTVWGEDCLEFRPERWLSADGTTFVQHDSVQVRRV